MAETLTPEQQAAKDRGMADARKEDFKAWQADVNLVASLTKQLKDAKESATLSATSLQSCPILVSNEHGKPVSIGALADMFLGKNNKAGIYQTITAAYIPS